VQFDVAIFTNLTAEHLDYHQTMEEYCKQKCRLFSSIDPDLKKKIPYPKLAIVNVDDRWSKEIIKSCRIPVLTYGITNEADLRAVDINLKEDGIEYVLDYLGSSYPVFIPLIGRFNVYNSLASIACAVSQNIPVEKALDAASRFPAVPGRLQPVPNQKGVKIFVDFAHTPDALDHVLKCLQETAKGKMITVFGCGGDRDPYKRPEMGKISEKYSDLTILTSDNPRSEDPSKIIREIAKGFQDKGRYAIEEDRQEAIRKAIEKAKKGDIVLIAGKGHETSQTFAHHTIEFNDWKVAREYSSI
jgi:UDP-N-acetylmuramoyl-L-alanyl-D-glutamate--2,6-diaminopimelate ligase